MITSDEMNDKRMEKYIDTCCRYYSGEEINPYEREEAWVWECERDYCAYCVCEDSSDVLDHCMDRYLRDGLGDFSPEGDFSLSFKAFMYVRFHKHRADTRPNDFKEWFSWFYFG